MLQLFFELGFVLFKISLVILLFLLILLCILFKEIINNRIGFIDVIFFNHLITNTL